MKCLLLAVFIAGATTAGAQQQDAELLQQLQAILEKEKSRSAAPSDTTIVVPWKGGGNTSFKKPGVYALPQDGMPCMVPNTADIAAIPNAMPQKKAVPFGKIPNAAPQTGEELKRNQRQFFAPPGR